MFNARKDIIDFFEKGIFPFKDNVFKTKENEEIKQKTEEEEIEEFINNAASFTKKESEGIKHDLFKEYFGFLTPAALGKKLFKIKDAKKNSEFVEEINKRRSSLKDEIEEMFKEEIKIKNQIKY